jgi:hypothetical protein
MSSQIDGNYRTFLVSTGYTGGLAGATTGGITAYLAVVIQSDGTITPANAANLNYGVGVLQEDVPAGYYGRVKLWGGAGTYMAAISGTAITPGTAYSIITGGYVGTATAGSYTASLLALQSSANVTNGAIVEFANINA